MKIMENIQELINQFSTEFSKAVKLVKNLDELEQIRVKFLGRTGQLTKIITLLKELSSEDKKIFGPKINSLKEETNKLFEDKKKNFESEKEKLEVEKKRFFDVTSYKYQAKGTLHPYTLIIEEIEDLFISMGFKIARGPEVETPFYNFDALNIPANHPARDMHDTFWLTLPEFLLRTHTSSVQIRAMNEKQPPIMICAPGRAYRHEATDATHDFVFNQVEMLIVDKNISIANLIGIIRELLSCLFHKSDLKIRVRTSYFPFVEPGLEVDIYCPFCKDGCSACKYNKWIEMGGAGLVHPNVLKACNIDPEKWTGCAFGFGIERMAMLKYQINDLRLFKNPKINFLKQF
jgi:phenylalanyl-tRNA synthetase alpha chain